MPENVTVERALAELEALGTEQNRKVYPRHGARPPIYGVSYADLGKLANRWRNDDALARGLWASGVHDARVLALMIADPARADESAIDAWLADVDNYGLAEALAAFVARTAFARAKADAWRLSPAEWPSATGWAVTANLALRDAGLSDDYFLCLLGTIEREIDGAPNRTRYEMNGALIAIGLRAERLREAALATAARVGKVTVDHGETGCRTPDAAAYIAKASARRAR